MQTRNNHKSRMAICIVAVLLGLSVRTPAQQPDNAALLYYQAFLLYEKPDATLANMRDDYRQGKIASNEAPSPITLRRTAVSWTSS